MKKLYTLICFILFLHFAHATTYYFSASGNDGYTGTSTGSPWKTILKFDSVFASKSPGDMFLFNRGDVFYGTLKISRNGTDPLPMVIGAYGTGANPIITGLTAVTAWTSLGGSIWESTSAVSTLTSCNMVLINGVNVPMGRYPNTGYFPYQSSTLTTLTSSSLSSGVTNWTGAEIVIRKNNWIIDRDTVTAHSGTVLTHTSHSIYTGTAGYGCFIQDDSRTLDTVNEWYYNPSTKKIRIYSPSTPVNVQISTIDTLVNGMQNDYMTFDGLTFTGSNKDAFVIPGSRDVTIQNCTIDFSGKDAIWGALNFGSNSATNFLLNANTINHTNNIALTIADEFTNAVISNNIIKNVGLQVGMGGDGTTNYGTDVGMVITESGPTQPQLNTVIEYNRLDSIGYSGIAFYGSGVTVRDNYVTNFCLTKIDGGGIYTWYGPGARSNRTNQKVYNNIVMNGTGSVAGTTASVPLAHGIYMDDGSVNVEVYNNVSANNSHSGLFIHNDSAMSVHNNTSYNNGVYQLLVTSYTTAHPLRNLTLKSNILVAKETSQKVASFESGANDITSFGSAASIDSNYYARPIDDNNTIQTVVNGSTTAQKTLATWQSFSGFDAHAHKSPRAITNVSELDFEYNPTSSTADKTLSGSFVDVTNAAYSGTITLQPYTGLVLINTGAATTYYFSATGSDAANGTTTAAPWQTITKFNTVFASRNPGDSFLFKRGDTFYGSLVISRSGTSASPMVIGAYGSGANPVITGFTSSISWSNLGSNIWESTSAVSALSSVNMVAINGVNTAMGRTPNTGYLTYQTFTSSTITSSSLTGSPNWTGAVAVIRKSPRVTDRDTITAQSSGTLTHTSHSGYDGTNNFGFFIQNDSRTLDALNEWYYNPSTKKIRIYNTSSPTNVKVATIDTLVKMSGTDYITFTGLSFTGANKDAFAINDAHYPHIFNCSIDYCGIDAIITSGGNCDSFKLINSTINHTNNNAISLDSGTSVNSLVSYDTIRNTGVLPGMGAGSDRSYSAIPNNPDNAIVENCFIDSTGYAGIGLYGDNTIVRNNLVTNFCITKVNSGGIYTIVGIGGTPFTGQKVLHNIILNGIGDNTGTTQTGSPIVHGIYLDDGTANVEVGWNTAANNSYSGVYSHNSYTHNIHHNTCYNNGSAQGLVTSYNATYPTRTMTIKKNIFFAKPSTQKAISWQSIGDDLALFGSGTTIDSNYYARPIDDNLTIETRINNNGTITQRSLSGWQTYASLDPHSHKSSKTITDENDLRFEYNSTGSSKNVSLPFNYMDVTGATYNGTITLDPNSSAVLMKNGSILGLVYATPEIYGPGKLTVRVSPNPAPNYFTLKLESKDKAMLRISIVDITGRVVEQRNVAANSTLQLGHHYSPGVYHASVTQGTDKVTIRLIKEGK